MMFSTFTFLNVRVNLDDSLYMSSILYYYSGLAFAVASLLPITGIRYQT